METQQSLVEEVNPITSEYDEADLWSHSSMKPVIQSFMHDIFRLHNMAYSENQHGLIVTQYTSFWDMRIKEEIAQHLPYGVEIRTIHPKDYHPQVGKELPMLIIHRASIHEVKHQSGDTMQPYWEIQKSDESANVMQAQPLSTIATKSDQCFQYLQRPQSVASRPTM